MDNKRVLIFATNNKHKIDEVQQMLHNKVLIKSLEAIGFDEEIPENEPTIEGNALFKARYIYNRLGEDCFADDSGLIVESLNGEPGVRSARYAGEEKNYQANNTLLLHNLANKPNRNAHFKTVIACIIGGKEYLFEGKVEGEIIEQARGTNGFGYDPIFVPNAYNKTFAELSADIKNKISHRAKAVEKFYDFIKNINT